MSGVTPLIRRCCDAATLHPRQLKSKQLLKSYRQSHANLAKNKNHVPDTVSIASLCFLCSAWDADYEAREVRRMCNRKLSRPRSEVIAGPRARQRDALGQVGTLNCLFFAGMIKRHCPSLAADRVILSL
jgi:hypothetical protein